MRKDTSGGKFFPLPSSLDEYSESPWAKRTSSGHLVGNRALMRKIFPFGVGRRGVDPRSPGACNARPGLLQIDDNLDGTTWTASALQGAPNGNILRIRAGKTTDNIGVEERQSFPALIKTTHFSVGLPWLTFLRPGETLIIGDCKEENPPKSGSFLSRQIT